MRREAGHSGSGAHGRSHATAGGDSGYGSREEANLALRPRGRLAGRGERGLEGQLVICRPGRCWRGGGRCAISEVARQR
jgi:hypothetical protein